MNAENIINEITKKLTLITYYIRFKTSANLNDINTILESCFKEILNITFGYNLMNLNNEYLYPAIDLGDNKNKIAFQITSTNDMSKIRKTLEKFNQYKLFENYNNLKILIISEKKAYKPKISIDTNFFTLKNDIISVFELIKYIKDIGFEKQTRILKILNETIGNNNININVDIESNEISTIMSIIQMLSNESIDEEIGDDSIPNPNHKINERFKEYKDYLNDMFVELSTLYANSYNKVQANLNIGTTQVKKMATFLRKESMRRLIEFNNDIMMAYDDMVNMIESKLKEYNNMNFDKNAIEYFIIKNIVDCNVFPNN